jgi:hypothetical protein
VLEGHGIWALVIRKHALSFPKKLLCGRCVRRGALRSVGMAIAAFAVFTMSAPGARADWLGAAAGVGTRLLVAGPPGAVVGGVVGGMFGKPFWGPRSGGAACWTDEHLNRHCRPHG